MQIKNPELSDEETEKFIYPLKKHKTPNVAFHEHI
jgi:hypothetical protein